MRLAAGHWPIYGCIVLKFRRVCACMRLGWLSARESSILITVSHMLAESDIGTANPKEKTIGDIGVNFAKEWTDEHTTAWLDIKKALMTYPTLRCFDPRKECFVYTDSSQFHCGGCLIQFYDEIDDDGKPTGRRAVRRTTLPISRLEVYATMEAWKMTHGLLCLVGVVG
eukprot:COSAG05_NODE_100_length_19386_cov_396.467154_10_plen_169_part_00